MIPKIIHYCWFGRGKMPELADICIASWKKHLPEYQLMLWNEDTFDINSNLYTKQAYEARKFAFVTDYVRLYALDLHGGIYMDTDVEILKPLEYFLQFPAFSGFEDERNIPTGLMASIKKGKWINFLLSYYDDHAFINPDGSLNIMTNTAIIGEMTQKWGFIPENSYQIIADEVHIFPKDYFCPKSQKTGEIELTENSYCIHHFSNSWMSPRRKGMSVFKKKLMKIFGEKNIDGLVDGLQLKKLKKWL